VAAAGHSENGNSEDGAVIVSDFRSQFRLQAVFAADRLKAELRTKTGRNGINTGVAIGGQLGTANQGR
jgi:hypothetical protein